MNIIIQPTSGDKKYYRKYCSLQQFPEHITNLKAHQKYKRKLSQTNLAIKLSANMYIRVFQKNTFSRKSKVQPTMH